MIEAIGFVAGTLTTLAFIPQTLQSLRTRSVNDLSLAMLIAFSGIVLWMVYGLSSGPRRSSSPTPRPSSRA